MAEIFPFRAFRYAAGRVQLADVLTQPYDKITPQMQERYSSLSPYNLVTVEKGRAHPGDTPQDNIYTRARHALDTWIAEGILIHESAPAIYAYSQEYSVPGSDETLTRRGFIALGRVEDYAAGVVHRHEQTLSGPRADRLELLRHTRAHTGQLFMLYSDPAKHIDKLLAQTEKVPAPVEVRDEYSVTHRLWPVTDNNAIEAFVAAMAGCKLVIADGHHRYETAIAYRDECRAAKASADASAPHEKVMMTFVNAESEGLTILPTHRILVYPEPAASGPRASVPNFSADAFIRKLEAWFEVRRFPAAASAAAGAPDPELVGSAHKPSLAHFVADTRAQRAIGFYAGGDAFWQLALRPQTDLRALISGLSPAQLGLDVVLLHRLILEKGLGITQEAVSKESHIRYEREAESAIQAVRAGKAQACFLLSPVSVHQVMNMALAGEVLPQKSTDFYPKLLSGLTIYRLDD
ncbi:MAG: DUF1015 domain-containing protein, partial [Candidatus Acidiferrales bacterium]